MTLDEIILRTVALRQLQRELRGRNGDEVEEPTAHQLSYRYGRRGLR